MGCFKFLTVPTSEDKYQRYIGWLEFLAYEMDNIKISKRKLEDRISREEFCRGRIRGQRVKMWFDKVKALEDYVPNLPLIDRTNFRFSSRSLQPIKQAINEAKLLADEFESMANEEDIKCLLQPSTVDERSDIWVDRKGRLHKLWQLVKEETVISTARIIGIHGMGGIGKTTLMRELFKVIVEEQKEMTKESGESDTIINWINVSMDYNASHIQDQIAGELGLTLPDVGDVQARTSCISHALSMKRKYILLLDDVWEALDFNEIGIPIAGGDVQQQQKRVLIFTTRNSEICLDLKAQIFQVPFLNDEESRELLTRRLGMEETIQGIEFMVVNKLVRRCGGLPSAIEFLAGDVMMDVLHSGSGPIRQRLMSKLTLYHLRDERSIWSRFTYAFGCLTDEEISCLLYFSFVCYKNLGQEIRNFLGIVSVEDAVNQLVGEGISPNSANISASKEKIHSIILRLEHMGLLKRLLDPCGEYVTMHACIREVLWGQNSADHISYNLQTQHLWRTAKRVHITLRSNGELPADAAAPCLNLHSLMITSSVNIPANLLTWMPTLRVLDLSRSLITLLPKTIKCLTELQYLNLSDTDIKCLPLEMGFLKNLRQLYFSGADCLDDIHRDSLGGLARLQALHFCASDSWYDKANSDPSQMKLTDLETMHFLKDFRFTAKNETSLHRLLTLGKLCLVTRALDLRSINDEVLLLEAFKSMSELEELEIFDSDAVGDIHTSPGQLARLEKLGLYYCRLSSIFYNAAGVAKSSMFSLHCLRDVSIRSCDNLHDVCWIEFAPCLKYLDVNDCSSVRELVPYNSNGLVKVLPKLEVLNLKDLWNLEFVYRGTLRLPSLKELRIRSCRTFRQHCFSVESVDRQNILIDGGNDSIEWNARTDVMLPSNTCPTISVSRNSWTTVPQEEEAATSGEVHWDDQSWEIEPTTVHQEEEAATSGKQKMHRVDQSPGSTISLPGEFSPMSSNVDSEIEAISSPPLEISTARPSPEPSEPEDYPKTLIPPAPKRKPSTKKPKKFASKLKAYFRHKPSKRREKETERVNMKADALFSPVSSLHSVP